MQPFDAGESARPQLRLLTGGAAQGAQAGGAAASAEPLVEEDPLHLLAGDVVTVLAGTPERDAVQAPLALPLALSACMARHCAGPEAMVDAMLALRRAVIAVSELDETAEPVPLAAGEPKAAALGLAAYLHELLVRAATASNARREALATAAAAQLRSA